MNTQTIKITGLIVCCTVLLLGITGCKKSEPQQTPDKPEAQPMHNDMDMNMNMDMEKTAADAVEAGEQTICPVMGNPINKDLFVEYQGKKVYFCCAGCKEKFLADPEKYLSKLPQFKEE